MVTLISRFLPGSASFDVKAALVQGTKHRIVVDTLIAPADMVACQDPTLVIYTHSDWDHCWGTAAFPGVPVIGHTIARERLLSQEAQEHLVNLQRESPEAFGDSRIIPPDITFDSSLVIDAGCLTLRLHHTPGHTADSLVVHIPELDLLLAGDVVENPIPSLNEPGHIRDWAKSLRRWEQAGLKQVVPSHGRPGGPELLNRNASYVEELLDRVGRFLDQGVPLDEMQHRMPVEEFVADIDQYPAYYRQGHVSNIAQVVAELKRDR